MSEIEYTRRREGVPVRGALGSFLMVELFTMQECQEIWDKGDSVPLDLMSHEFWREPGAEFPRYSSEMLGDAF